VDEGPRPERDRQMATTTVSPTSRSKSPARRIVEAAVSVALVAAVFFFALPQIADFSEVWAEIREMTAFELGTLLLIALWNLATYWFVMVSSLPGSNLWQAMKINGASTAVANSLPGGGALGIAVNYGMYLQYGFSREAIALSLLVSGIWNNFVKLGMPVLALALLGLQGGATGPTLTAALAGLATLAGAIVLFALVLRSERTAGRVGAFLSRLLNALRRIGRRKDPVDLAQTTVEIRRQAIDLLRRRWLWLTLTTLVSHVSLFLVLLVTLRHVGVSENEVGWVEVLAAFAFIRLISALPITPGGLGVVELGYTAALVAAGGQNAQVVAAVLVFRALTYLLPIPWGLLTYARWKQGAARRRERVEDEKGAMSEDPSVPVGANEGPES
jgi:putative heme transporter